MRPAGFLRTAGKATIDRCPLLVSGNPFSDFRFHLGLACPSQPTLGSASASRLAGSTYTGGWFADWVDLGRLVLRLPGARVTEDRLHRLAWAAPVRPSSAHSAWSEVTQAQQPRCCVVLRLQADRRFPLLLLGRTTSGRGSSSCQEIFPCNVPISPRRLGHAASAVVVQKNQDRCQARNPTLRTKGCGEDIPRCMVSAFPGRPSAEPGAKMR
jgi:hypothetical protein